MALRITPFLKEHEAAASRFNQRMQEGRAATDFLLPERAPEMSGTDTLRPVQFVAVDNAGEIHGGMLCVCCPASVNGSVTSALNLQSVLSEGLVDPRHAMVGAQLVKFAVKQNPYVYVVGMGNEGRPLPRLLRACGWKVRPVPFYFRLLHGGRCFRQLGPLRGRALYRIAGTAAAATGAASLAARFFHRVAAPARRLAREQNVSGSIGWSACPDPLWDAFQRKISFGVLRDAHHAELLYSADGNAEQRVEVTARGRAVAWFSLYVTRMRDNPYFGNLTVATLADCIGEPDWLAAALAQAAACARGDGADLLITNQQHRVLREACVQAGFRKAESNFLLATSPALSAGIQEDTVYVTRRDGDGLIHLS